jgi:hypothetical protein
MDRGINDIKAYMRPDQWKELLDMHHLTEKYIDSRYDLILHLVTAADGAETCVQNNIVSGRLTAFPCPAI